MPFDVLFHTCHLSEKAKEAVNPFRGKSMKVPDGETATEAERATVVGLLAEAESFEIDAGVYGIEVSEESGAKLCFFGLEDAPEFTGGFVTIRGLTPELCRFLHTLATAGSFTIHLEDDRVAVTADASADAIAKRHPDLIVVRSPDELLVILKEAEKTGSQHQ